MPTHKLLEPLTEEEHKALLLMLQEAESRGMKLQPQTLAKFPNTEKKIDWPVAPNGFFIRDDGHLYQPTEHQRAFIDSNARFVLFRGGRGCLAGNTIVDGVPIADRISPALVSTLFGSRLATDGFLKGRDFLYRVLTQSGNSVEATGYHQFLTPLGWRRLNQLSIGDLVRSDGTVHGEPVKEKSSDWLDDCPLDFRLYGELYNSFVTGVLDKWLRLHRIDDDSSAWLVDDHLSIVDSWNLMPFRLFVEYLNGQVPYAQLHSGFQSYLLSRCIRTPDDINQLQNSKLEFCLADFLPSQFEPPFGEGRNLLWAEKPLVVLPLFSENEVLDIAAKYRSRENSLFSSRSPFDVGVLGDQSDLSCYLLPYRNKNNYTQEWEEIKSISYTRYGDFYDIQVPVVHHYAAQGFIHHNSGKSGAGAQKALKRIMAGESGAVINPVFADFKTSTWPEFKRWIPWNMVVPAQRHRRRQEWEPHQPFIMSFVNGAQVYCKGLNNPRGARGANINWLWYDEAASDPTGMAWNIAVAAVRVGVDPQCWATTTPKGTEHWVYKFFINRDIPEEVTDVLAKSDGGNRILIENFHGSIEENKQNLDPAFYASILMAYPSGWLRAQEAEGEFANEGGKIGDRFWFHEKSLTLAPENPVKRVRFWDLAGTEKKRAKDDPDETVGALVSKFYKDDRIPQFCIEDMVCGYWEEEKLMQNILDTARFDGPGIPVYIEQEPASSGKNFVAVIRQEFKKHPELANHRVEGIPAKDIGDRVLAASTYWFGQAAQGNMWMLKGPWNDRFLGQLDGFTQLEHDDRVTAVTGAMYKLNPYRIWKRVPFLAV